MRSLKGQAAAGVLGAVLAEEVLGEVDLAGAAGLAAAEAAGSEAEARADHGDAG